MTNPNRTSSDTVDVADLARTLRRQWRAIASGVALGVLAGSAVMLFAPRRYDGLATVLARSSGPSGGSISSRMTGVGELLGGIAAFSGAGGIETELQLLRSRELGGLVVDSLQLQVRIEEPAGRPANALFGRSSAPGSFSAGRYVFEGQSGGTYLLAGSKGATRLAAGTAVMVGPASLTLRAGLQPARIAVRIEDREAAIDRLARRTTITKAGGEVVKIVVRGEDSVSAASSANALVSFYLDRRAGADRGINHRRVEYVTAQLDSVGGELARTEAQLRRYQESSRVLDADVQGKVEMEASADYRKTLTELQVDEGSIKQLLAQADGGRLTSRDLAGYPGFLHGSAVAPLVTQLGELEARRIQLLEHRTERDPEVQSVDQTMRLVEGNILGMARSYAGAVTRQREQFQARVDSLQQRLLALPAAKERGGRLGRDVTRLTMIYTALEAQLVEARLGAIGEGGAARQVDVAYPARRPAFPSPILTMAIGTGGGLLCGVFAALLLGLFGRWLRDPIEIERAIGVSALRIQADAPLLLSGTATARSLLVVPLDHRAYVNAADVAERLARTARQRSLQAALLDLRGDEPPGAVGRISENGSASSLIERFEREHGVTIVQMRELSHGVTLGALSESRPVLLVAPPGPVDRGQLSGAVELLRRLSVPCAGVIISDASRARMSSRP